jgi:YihY family inner membrane protein
MNTVWAVPRNERPNPVRSRVRSLAVLATIGVGVLATTGLSVLTTDVHAGAVTRPLELLLSLAVNVGLFVAAFRLLTDPSVSTHDLLPGAVTAAIAWQVLQVVGAYYIAHVLKNAGEVYGLFGLVLGLVAWIHLGALVVVGCAELNVVRRHRLWPRALLTPFTDDVELTSADKRAYTSYAKAARNKGFEQIDVSFDRE